MGLLDCLHIAVPFLGTIAAAVFLPVGYKVYKTGLKATTSYLIGLPTRLAGIVGAAYASKITKVFAVATALGGTIKAGTTALSTDNGWMHVAAVFTTEVYRETLSATGLISTGFQQLTAFLTQPGVCSHLVNLELIAFGLFNLWRGIAIVIVILTLWGYYRSRGRKTEVDFDEKILLIVALFSATALINSGGDGSQLVQAVRDATNFMDTLSQQISGDTAVNQSMNATNNTVNPS